MDDVRKSDGSPRLSRKDRPAKIRLLLVEDLRLVREGLRALLERETDLVVAGEASDGRAAVALYATLRPHVVLMDVNLPQLNGVEATRRIVAADASARVVALSVHTDQAYVTRMLEAGAVGYVLKDSTFADLAQAIREAARGRVYLSPAIAGVVVNQCLQGIRTAPQGVYSAVTPREKEVIQLISEGLTTHQIAGTLKVSSKTIETHRARVMSKLKIRSISGLTKYAIREGLTSLDMQGNTVGERRASYRT